MENRVLLLSFTFRIISHRMMKRNRMRLVLVLEKERRDFFSLGLNTKGLKEHHYHDGNICILCLVESVVTPNVISIIRTCDHSFIPVISFVTGGDNSRLIWLIRFCNSSSVTSVLRNGSVNIQMNQL